MIKIDRACVWSVLTMHASEDASAAVSGEILVGSSCTSTPLKLCRFDPEGSEGGWS